MEKKIDKKKNKKENIYADANKKKTLENSELGSYHKSTVQKIENFNKIFLQVFLFVNICSII